MIRLFDENDRYTATALAFSNEAHKALEPVIKLAIERGYSLRDVECLLQGEVFDSVCSAILGLGKVTEPIPAEIVHEAAVAELQQTIATMRQTILRLETELQSQSSDPCTAGFSLTADERQAIREGHQIVAIKLIRERTNVGLLAAKRIVERVTP